MRRTVDYKSYLLERLRRDPEEAIAYLNAALEDGESTFLVALKDVVEARIGMTRMAEAANLHRVSLYKMFSEEGNPTLKSLDSVLDAMGLKIAITSKLTQQSSTVSRDIP